MVEQARLLEADVPRACRFYTMRPLGPVIPQLYAKPNSVGVLAKIIQYLDHEDCQQASDPEEEILRFQSS